MVKYRQILNDLNEKQSADKKGRRFFEYHGNSGTQSKKYAAMSPKSLREKTKSSGLRLRPCLRNGHMLLDDVPGTGKTMLAKSLAKSIGTEFRRVQFTPDLLPSDLTGINFFNQKES